MSQQTFIQMSVKHLTNFDPIRKHTDGQKLANDSILLIWAPDGSITYESIEI